MGWGRDTLGALDLYLRKSRNREDPTFGVALKGPKIDQLMVEATYVSQGPKAWQLSASNPKLIERPRGIAGLSLRVTGLRPEEEGTPIQDTLLMAVAPQFQVFPWGTQEFPVGIVMARPYILGGVTVESPLTELDLKPTFRVGVGSEVNLFGLYPSDISLGVKWIPPPRPPGSLGSRVSSSRFLEKEPKARDFRRLWAFCCHP